MAQKRIHYLDALRIIAVFAVICIHVSARFYHAADVYSVEWAACNFWEVVSRFAVPVYVMISGSLFLDPSRKIDRSRLFRHNISRIVVSFSFWSAAYILFRKYILGHTLGLGKTFEAFVCGHYHLWYLYMIAGLYILVPMLRKITDDKDMLSYFVAVGTVFSITIPTVSGIVNAILPILDNARLSFAANAIKSAYSNIHFHFTLEYVFYFVFGYWLHSKEIDGQCRRILYASGVMSALSSILFSLFIAREKGAAWGYYGYLTLPNALITAAVFVFSKYSFRTPDQELTPPREQLLFFVGDRCFGVYLVHDMVLQLVLARVPLTSLSYSAFIAIPVLSGLTFLVSLAIVCIIKRIPVLGKTIV